MALGHGEVAIVNRYLVREYFRANPGSTRTAASEELSLSAASVSRIVSDLLRDGVLIETERSQDPSVTPGPGRPGVGLRLRPQVICVAAIDVGGSRCLGRLADLDGRTLEEFEVSVQEAEDAYRAMVSIWEQLNSASKERGLDIAFLTIGIPAVMDPKTGLVWRGPNVGWEGFDLRRRVESFGVPFEIENDTNLSAIAEHRYGAGQGAESFALITVGTGLGAALMIDGTLVRGYNNAAGELGHMVVGRHQVLEDYTGRRGGLEAKLSGVGIALMAREKAKSNPELRKAIGAEPTAREIIGAAVAGNPEAQEVLEEIVQYLALSVINLSSVIDPEVIIIDGSVGRALTSVFPRVRTLVGDHVPDPPELLTSQLERSTMSGAIALALDNFRSQQTPVVLTELSEIRIQR